MKVDNADYKLPEEVGVGHSVIQNLEEQLHRFLQGGYKKSLYLPHSKSFSSEPASQLFSLDSFEHLIASFGVHSGFQLDIILTSYASKTMFTIFDIYTKISSDAAVWLQDFHAEGSKWTESVTRPEIQKAAEEMIRLGNVLVIREMLRTAIKNVTEKCLPGFTSIVAAAYNNRKVDNLNEKEYLIAELFTNFPNYHFIEVSLSNYKITKTSDAIMFFFFFALLLGAPSWKDCIYSSEHEIINKNLSY